MYYSSRSRLERYLTDWFVNQTVQSACIFLIFFFFYIQKKGAVKEKMLWAIPSFVAQLRRWSSKRDSLTFRSPVHKSYLDLLVLMSKPVSPLEFCGFFKLLIQSIIHSGYLKCYKLLSVLKAINGSRSYVKVSQLQWKRFREQTLLCLISYSAICK